MKRLSDREELRYGAEVLAPGGPRHVEYQAFLRWAAAYDDPDFDGRSRTGHEAWLEHLSCPVMRLDSAAPVADLVATIQAANIEDLQ